MLFLCLLYDRVSLYMDDRETKIQQLKEYFEKRDDVVMAFLFGSQAKGYARNISDWDIAVYIVQENHQAEQTMWADIEKITETEVDLVVLNRAPATLIWEIFRNGIMLVMKNRKLYQRLMFSVGDEANAWYETSRDYYRVFERSQSLSPEDEDRLRRILTFLEEAVDEYEQFRSFRQEEYMHDRVVKRNIEHWIEHMIVSVVDIAEIILASQRLPLPSIYRELVIALGGVEPFTADDTCKRLAERVQLRNLLAHEYMDYRWKQISEFLQYTEPLFRIMIERTQKFIEKNRHEYTSR